MESFAQDMISNLYGNPHSMSQSSQRSTKRTEDVRLRALQFFNADPEEYDLVFVANATSAIKLVAEAFRDLDPRGFWYGYHIDSHTSLVGVRELANLGYECLRDVDVDGWVSKLGPEQSNAPKLLAFPAQSNLNGRRLPVRWCKQIRTAAGAGGGNVFSLLDAASYVSTAPLDVDGLAPDFVALSFYKIFGFPDLGALIVRKSAAWALERRKFFGGGTVDMVIATGAQWHAKKETSIHEQLEDGTLPFHSIIALGAAFDTHQRIYGSMAKISAHTGLLAKLVYDSLSSLRHYNRTKVCRIYQSGYGNLALQGPIVAFNLQNSRGEWIPKSDIERLAAARNIHLRSGSVCNPGGTASSLGWTAADLSGHYAAGLRCGDNHDVLDGRPTGVLRISLGAMTNLRDIQSLIRFIKESYVEKAPPAALPICSLRGSMFIAPRFYIESLAVFPIRGCGAFKVPAGKSWEIHRDGLAWDRAWCLVHEMTGKALDEETYPQMTHILPTVDPDRGSLRVSYDRTVDPARDILHFSCDRTASKGLVSLEIPLGWAKQSVVTMSKSDTNNCYKEGMPTQSHLSILTKTFFSEILGVPCTLARYSSQSTSPWQAPQPSNTCGGRMRKLFRSKATHKSGQRSRVTSDEPARPIVSKPSAIHRMNQATAVHATRGIAVSKPINTDMFRANIVVAERLVHMVDAQKPNAEQHWSSLRIGQDRVCLSAFPNDRRTQPGHAARTTGTDRMKSIARVMIRQANGKNLLGEYTVLPTEDIDICEPEKLSRKTIAVRDVVLPVSSEGD